MFDEPFLVSLDSVARFYTSQIVLDSLLNNLESTFGLRYFMCTKYIMNIKLYENGNGFVCGNKF